jgi:oxygen-independent coproporphyrinogen-3 oxidase
MSSLFQRLAELPVPRYTSYPTAADFSSLGPTDQKRWLSELDGDEPISVYLHVPYCRQLCHYCGCHAKAVRQPEPVADYCRALEAEIALVAACLPKRARIGRIAWGGGTPSILGAEGLASVLGALTDNFDFVAGYEHSIELDPRMLDRKLCDALAVIGISRVSLGVQDLDPDVQQAIGRIQQADLVGEAVANLRNAGIGAINFDLIYGLPNQTRESILATCRSVADFGPDRIAFYGYAHLPSRRANQRLIDERLLPGSTARMEQAAVISDFFQAEGFQAVGIDHFAKPSDPMAIAARQGRLHRNFQGYTDDDRQTLIGFGCSSISQLPGGYVQSESGIEAYKKLIGEGSLAAKRGHALTADDRRRAAIVERLMCDFEVDLGDDVSDYADDLGSLKSLVANGIAEVDGGRVTVTPLGRPFVRLVAAAFDSYRANGAGRFSLSV